VNVHEYQAKAIFARFGIPIPPGNVAETVDEAKTIAEEIGLPVMVKAQVHIGGRGKAGGVKFCPDIASVETHAANILGMRISNQQNPKGQIVQKILVTEAKDIASEAYLGITIDRKTQRPVILASSEGGVEIEEVAKTHPEKIFKHTVDPRYGLQAYEARQIMFNLYDDAKIVNKAAGILLKLYQAFTSSDASLAEINPLITTPDKEVWAIDAKVNIDDNGLYRHADIAEMRDTDLEEPAETLARSKGLSYVKLDGNVGCIVNGAGLAMATMDLIKHFGAEPANFLDIGGSSNPEKVTTAMQIILDDPNVKAILFNIFGGITRCDDVANGIVTALKNMDVHVPVVVRLTGTNEDLAKEILAEANLPMFTTMNEVVQHAIELANAN